MQFELEPLEDRKTATNPYVVWGEDVGEYLNSREFYTASRAQMSDLRMVFVRAKDTSKSAEEIFEQVESLTTYRVGEVERALAAYRAEDEPLEFIATVDATWDLIGGGGGNETEFFERFEVIAAGARLFGLSDSGAALQTVPDVAPDHGQDKTPVVAAIIDDGIPYLNKRFFNGDAPRIQSLLLQTSACLVQGGVVQSSRVLGADEIAHRRAQADIAGEQAVYKTAHRSDPLLAAGVPTGVRKTVEQAASHGAFMLDLMAGAPPHAASGSSPAEDTLRGIPILAAQLPPQSVDDTSGARLELPILSALRWTLAKTAEMRPKPKPQTPIKLVVNLSFGMSAGSKDGNGLMETAFERHVALAARAGIDMHLVLPFGNEYRSRGVQVSPLDVKDNAAFIETSTEVVVGRADETPSFVEIRAKDLAKLPTDLEISVSGPGGDPSGFVSIPEGDSAVVTLDGRAQGRIFHVPAQSYFDTEPHAASLLFALSPTAEPRRRPTDFKLRSGYPNNLDLATPGRWTIRLRQPANTETPCEAIFQVQRDDSAFGYHNRGVQTVLDARTAHVASDLFRDMSGLRSDSEITHLGTNTTYVSRRRQTVPGRGGIYAVAAARDFKRKDEAKDDVAASYYSSERADWSARSAPDIAVEIDTAASNPGVTASGTASGSAMRQTGSSAAAALFSRSLLTGRVGSKAMTVPKGKQNRLGKQVASLPGELRKKARRRTG